MKLVNKKKKNLIFAMLYFLKKKIKKNTWRYHYQNLKDMIYSSRDVEQNKLKLVTLGHFLPFYPPKNPKNQNFEKSKNLMEISFYTCVPKITIIWCTVPEIRSETNRTFCHFEPLLALFIILFIILYYPFIHTCVP